jgi:hypothetical protein
VIADNDTREQGVTVVAEVLVEFSDPVKAEDGRVFMAQACGSEMQNGLWQGWIEFVPVGGGDPLRSTRATTQPNRQDTVYWATGLTPVYLEGALQRTLRPLAKALAPDQPVAAFFDGPAAAEDLPRAGAASVLNPFSLYRKGESLLRRQLGALSSWHLVNIIDTHGLSDESLTVLNAHSPASLIEIIVDGVRRMSRVER